MVLMFVFRDFQGVWVARVFVVQRVHGCCIYLSCRIAMTKSLSDAIYVCLMIRC